MNPNQNLPERFPAAALATAMAIAGTIGAFVVEAGLDPVTTVFWRCSFAALFLAAWCMARGYLTATDLSMPLLLRAALGGVCIVLNWVAFFAALQMTSIATTTIVYHVQPFFVVLLGAWFFRERITPDQLLWMLGAFAGVVLASGLMVDPLVNTVANSTQSSTLKLTLFHGHLTFMERGVRDAQIKAAVPGGVSPTDHRAGPCWQNAGRAFA